MLTFTVAENRNYRSDYVPGDGTCTPALLKRLGLLELLGIELLARLRAPERITLLQEVFVVAASAGNGPAALAAFGHLFDSMLPLRQSNSIETQLSVEAFGKNARQEYYNMFRWLDSVYWALPHYEARPWSTSLRGSGIDYEDPLRAVKDRVIGFVASCWGVRDDALGQAALTFLRDHHSERHFRLRREAAGAREYLPLQQPDQRSVEQSLRSHLLHVQVDQVERALIVAKQLHHSSLYKILSHGWVNAGGDPVLLPKE